MFNLYLKDTPGIPATCRFHIAIRTVFLKQGYGTNAHKVYKILFKIVFKPLIDLYFKDTPGIPATYRFHIATQTIAKTKAFALKMNSVHRVIVQGATKEATVPLR